MLSCRMRTSHIKSCGKYVRNWVVLAHLNGFRASLCVFLSLLETDRFCSWEEGESQSNVCQLVHKDAAVSAYYRAKRPDGERPDWNWSKFLFSLLQAPTAVVEASQLISIHISKCNWSIRCYYSEVKKEWRANKLYEVKSVFLLSIAGSSMCWSTSNNISVCCLQQYSLLYYQFPFQSSCLQLHF